MAKSRVKKRPDGRYAMQIYIGMVDGKRKYKTVYGATPKEVERKAEEVRLMLGRGLDVAAMRDTVKNWADRWHLHAKSRSYLSMAGADIHHRTAYSGCPGDDFCAGRVQPVYR